MRIIYGHDYYDNALAFGRDEAIVFVRQKEHFLRDTAVPFVSRMSSRRFWFWDKKKEEIISFYRPRHRGNWFQIRDTIFNVKPIVVIFCGKVYTGLQIDIEVETAISSIYFWDVEHFTTWLDSMGLALFDKQSRYHHRYRRSDITDPEAFFVVYDAPKPLMDWLIETKVTVAIWHPYPDILKYDADGKSLTWDINSDRLKNIQFYKKIDPYTAFQEISMWIGGILPGSGAEMAKVSDAIRIEKHGFDKTSFRKSKSS